MPAFVTKENDVSRASYCMSFLIRTATFAMNRKLFFLTLGFYLICGLSAGWAGGGLIGYWPLDGDVLDYSGKGNNGALLAGANFVPSPTGDRQVLQAAGMGLNEGHVRVALPSSYHPQDGAAGFKGSGSFWVIFDDKLPTTTRDITQEVLAHMPGIAHVYRQNNPKRNWMQTMVRHIDGEGALKNTWPVSSVNCVQHDGVWYHIAWTFHSNHVGEEGHFRWYINGRLDTEYNSTGLLASRTTNFRIGGSNNGYGCNAKIAEVRLYDRILTAEEVLELSRQKNFSPVGHYPTWWWQHGFVVDGVRTDDFAAVNQGQLKHVATQTASYLDQKLAVVGGAGASIGALVDSWAVPSDGGDDYAAINLGQLKFVSAKFYDRLNEVIFSQWPDSMNIDVATGYPWSSVGNGGDDYALANQGQLKFLFSWDPAIWLSADTNGDGLPDWLQQYMLSLNPNGDVDPNGDFDGDGISNIDEYQNGGLVIDFYNGAAGSYQIEVVGTGTVVGRPGDVADGSIQIIVRDSVGSPVVNAPLYLRPEVVTALLGIDAHGEAFTAPLLIFTDVSGMAVVYVKP